jgi:hypothetical protein
MSDSLKGKKKVPIASNQSYDPFVVPVMVDGDVGKTKRNKNKIN